MNCLKCGVDIPVGQVFCMDCLQRMAASPVDPGTPIHIPYRAEPDPVRPAKRRRKGYADTMRMLRKVIRWLCVAVAVLTVLVCILASLLYQTLDTDSPDIGKNYTTMETN